MTLLVRDEVDIVRRNVEYHLGEGVDLVIVTDNGSVDGTREVLGELERAGHVRVIDEPAHTYQQDRWVTRMALLARDVHGADWIINADADEFWYTSAGDLRTALAALEPGVALVTCSRRHMFQAHDVAPSRDWPADLVYRVDQPVPVPTLEDPMVDPLPDPYLYLDLPSKVICRARGLTAVHQGNHGADYDSATSTAQGTIVVYHYPVRSFAQFVRKIDNGGAAYLRNPTAPQRQAWHWRRWYRMLQQGDPELAYRETVPSAARLGADLATGRVHRDTTMARALARSSSAQPANG
jgi:hypothetical protein